jgi:hypothetical protein
MCLCALDSQISSYGWFTFDMNEVKAGISVRKGTCCLIHTVRLFTE